MLIIKGTHSPILHVQAVQFWQSAPSKEALCMTTLSNSKPFPMSFEDVRKDENFCHRCELDALDIAIRQL